MSCFRRGVSAATSLAAVLACADCSGGGGGGTSTPTPPPPVVVTRTFPANVAVAAGGGTAWDIIGVKTTLTGQFESGGGNLYDTLRVDVTFSQDVANALPLPGQPLSGLNQLGISIGLDTDGNPNTGQYKTCNLSSSEAPFEYVSDQGNDPSRLADGNYSIIGPDGAPIYSGSSNPPAEAQTVVSQSTVSQTFFLGAIGVADGSKVPKLGVGVVSVNGFRVVYTDCVPAGTQGVEIFTDGS
jgi:hypothetical protein